MSNRSVTTFNLLLFDLFNCAGFLAFFFFFFNYRGVDVNKQFYYNLDFSDLIFLVR